MLERAIIRFVSWFIWPLGYRVVPMDALTIIAPEDCKFELDQNAADKIVSVIINHKPKMADNVVVFDKNFKRINKLI